MICKKHKTEMRKITYNGDYSFNFYYCDKCKRAYPEGERFTKKEKDLSTKWVAGRKELMK